MRSIGSCATQTSATSPLFDDIYVRGFQNILTVAYFHLDKYRTRIPSRRPNAVLER